MRLWPFRRPEVRSAGFTAQIVQAAVDAAAATGTDVATATAAVETAAGLWSRVLSLAIVQPMNRRTAALTPSLLAMAGRELAARGEFIADIRVDPGGAVRLIPAAASYVVRGGGDPRSWVYSLTAYGPTDSQTYDRPRASVAHLHYGTTAAAPWRGVPPWAGAALSGRLLAGVERQLANEGGSASGYILSAPDTGDWGQGEDDDGAADPLTSLRADMAAARGRTMVAPAMAAGFGAGAGAAPASGEYRSSRRAGGCSSGRRRYRSRSWSRGSSARP